MAIGKGDLISWIILCYNQGIIRNYEMSKKDARTFFYKSQLHNFKSLGFSAVLSLLNKNRLITSEASSTICFDRQQLDKILDQHTATKNNKNTNLKSIPKQQLYKCKTCLVGFKRETDLENHRNNDEQHYFRNLYLSNSQLLKKSSSDIIIEITKGSGLNRELLLLNSGSAAESHIYVKNLSKHTYILDDIIELHQNRKDIRIKKNNLPIILSSKVQIKLDMLSRIQEVTTMLFVHAFIFVNKSNGNKLNILKEITLHVNAETCRDLLPTSKYVKTVPVRNDINPRVYVKVGGPRLKDNYVVQLERYNVPRDLEKILAAGLKPFHKMTNNETTCLNKIKVLLDKNDSGQHLTRNNYFHLLDLLIHMEDYQLSIDIRNYDTVTQDLIKVRGYNDRYQLTVPDLAERRPSLLPGDSVYVKCRDTKTFEGVVRMINQDTVILEFNRKFSNIYAPGISLSLTYGFNRSNIRAEHRSVDILSQHRVLAPFFPTRILMSSIKNYSVKWFNSKITANPQQQQAVLHILSRTSYPSPYLIFGPPGTGKTMTIVEAISQVWAVKPKANVLVCAPSNSVANEIALRLTQYVPKSQLFRYMSLSYGMYDIPDEVLPFTNYDCGDFYQPTPTDVCSYRIIITTLSNASRLVSMGVPATHFSYVFIDESGHATETETLIPIAGLITAEENAGTVLAQIVLAGDPKQLGPIIHSAHARQYGYGVSMLERLMTTIDIYKRHSDDKYNPMALTKLLHNYRSHPAILYLPNKMFYDNELVPKGDDLINIALNWELLPNKKMPLIFHSVVGLDQREQNSPSYFNVQEIQIVMKYLNELIGNRLKGRQITQKDIGVIAPYRKQVQKIRKACEKQNWNDLTIGSVEQFQGQERLIIIVSTVRSQPKLLKFDNKFHLGFLNNPKRFNVAITRAKSLVIVVGNPNLLQYETYWRIFIQYCKDNKCMTGEPFEFSHKLVDALALDMAKLRIDGAPDDLAVNLSRENI